MAATKPSASALINASGTASSGTFLRGDNAWAEVATGGGSWDHIVTSSPGGSASLTYTVGAGSTLNTSTYDLFKI